MRTTLLAVTIALALGGCATVPQPACGRPFRHDHAAAGSQPECRTASKCAGVARSSRSNRAPMSPVSKSCRANCIPTRDQNRHDHSDGRFIACGKGFYDPAVYTKGRDLTVVGEPQRHRAAQGRRVQLYFSTCERGPGLPVAETRQLCGYYDPWQRPYYDPFWGPSWGWGGGFWAPPVVIVHSSPPPHH